MDKDVVGVGLFGFGNIGAGVVDTLAQNRDVIMRNTGVEIKLLKVVDIDIERDRGVAIDKSVLSVNAEDIIDNPDISVVIELIGGASFAKSVVERCLEKGKSVVTANKELIAKHGAELVALAGKNNARLLFEASVGGGIPVLTPLLTCLRANRIDRIVGIVNGTTNYILTQMAETGGDFQDILKDAQDKGFAEADPTNDIEGFDSAYKTVILCSVGLGFEVKPGDVYREGITKISLRDIRDAHELGFAIKLLSVSENRGGSVAARVHPCLVPLSHPLAGVNGVLNGIYVEGRPIGPLMFVGRGAGAPATSSAVIGDVISIAAGTSGARPAAAVSGAKLFPMEDAEFSFYIRMTVTDRPGVLAEVSKIFGENKVSIQSLTQKSSGGEVAEIVWLTHCVSERCAQGALSLIKELDCVRSVDTVIRALEV